LGHRGRGQAVRDARPLATATTRLPPCQQMPAALAYDGLGCWGGLKKPQRRWLRQVWNERMQLRKREGNGGSQLVTERADALLQGHGPPHQAIGGREGRITDNGQKELARPESVQDTGGIFFIGFTGALRHRLAIVPHRLAVPQAALIATAVEPFVEGLPVDPRWFHGDQE